MGLDTASIKFVCAAKSFGVDFTDTLMIGRQSLLTTPAALQRVFSILGIDLDADEFLRKNAYGEAFFSLMGAEKVNSLDYSSYEDPTIIHDMNLPISDDLRGRYSVVYDGGTLEHVFNMPQALKNCMEMVRVGGHFMQVHAANNFMGHGFWQLSPELIFRAFSAANGYQVRAVLLHEVLPDARWICRNDAWYAVADPDEIKQRVELCNSFSTYILTIARKVSDIEIFEQPPQQSDYVAAWGRHTLAKTGSASALDSRDSDSHIGRPQSWRTYVPKRIKRMLRSLQRMLQPVQPVPDPFDRPYFKCIRENDLLRGKLK
jgi:hypothetical protein